MPKGADTSQRSPSIQWCSAAVLLALGDLLDRNVTAAGDAVLLAGFGAGLTWAAALFEWGETARRPPDSLALRQNPQRGRVNR